MFKDQVNTISAMFEQWNECEQTVVLYSLLKRLSPAKARFLALALDRSFANCVELQLHEHQANNPGFVSSLLAEGKEVAISQLLIHLPLLRPGNTEAKTRYLSVILKVLSHSVETGTHTEEAQQLLSYCLIHPAISNEDKRCLTQWVRLLEVTITNGNLRTSSETHCDSPQHSVWAPLHSQHNKGNVENIPANGHYIAHHSAPSIIAENSAVATGQVMENISTVSKRVHSNPISVNYSNGSHARVRRSNSLTPPVSITQTSELWSSQDDLSGRQKPRSFSLSSEHVPPLSPQSSLASSGSGSESHLDELRLGFYLDGCGMRDVPAWLKSLRLHKYTWLFAQLSYEEMLGLTEEQLASHGVTKGARHKIVISIRKLRDRFNTLCQLEKDVVEGGSMCNALEELKAVLISPIKASKVVPVEKERDETESSDSKNRALETRQNVETVPENSNSLAPDDIPAQFTKVMGKVCTQLLVSNRAEEELVRLFISLVDHSLQHDAFTSQQKLRLGTWKLQIQEAWHLLPSHNKGSEQRHARNKWHHNQFSVSTSLSGYPHTLPHVHHLLAGNRSQPFGAPLASPYQQQRSSTGKSTMNNLYPSPQSVGQQHHRNSLSVIGSKPGVGSSFMAKRPSLQDTLMEPSHLHSTLQRTKSAPPKPNQFCGLSFGGECESPGAADPEINSRLESLCLSMTEHALGGGNEV